MKMTPVLITGLVAFTAFAYTQTRKVTPQPVYLGSSFNEVWSKVRTERYKKLPTYKIVSASNLKTMADFAMNGTLDDRNDFRQRRIKLVHPNGVCLAGFWDIDQSSKYSGYFSKDSRGLIIARASVTQDYVNIEDYRAFGLAVKIFPTLDPNEKVYTSNLFTVDNIEGSKNRRFIDTLMTNQIPDFNFLNLGNLTRLASRLPFLVTFNNKSKEMDSGPDNRNPLLRRTVEAARAGIAREFSALAEASQLPSYKSLERTGKVKEPKWVGFEAESVTIPSIERDFRNETIDVLNQNRELRFKILVAEKLNADGNKQWKRIGTLIFNKGVSSLSCDQDLHFHHPRTDN